MGNTISAVDAGRIINSHVAATNGAIEVDIRAKRPVKVVDAEGKVLRESDTASVLVTLLAKEDLASDVIDAEAREHVRLRREAGLPDLCAGCSRPLGMSKNTLAERACTGCMLCAKCRHRGPPPSGTWGPPTCEICKKRVSKEATRCVSCAKRTTGVATRSAAEIATGPVDHCEVCNEPRASGGRPVEADWWARAIGSGGAGRALAKEVRRGE